MLSRAALAVHVILLMTYWKAVIIAGGVLGATSLIIYCVLAIEIVENTPLTLAQDDVYDSFPDVLLNRDPRFGSFSLRSQANSGSPLLLARTTRFDVVRRP